MIKEPPPFKGLNIGIPIIIFIKGSGLINQGSGLGTWRFREILTSMTGTFNPIMIILGGFGGISSGYMYSYSWVMSTLNIQVGMLRNTSVIYGTNHMTL